MIYHVFGDRGLTYALQVAPVRADPSTIVQPGSVQAAAKFIKAKPLISRNTLKIYPVSKNDEVEEIEGQEQLPSGRDSGSRPELEKASPSVEEPRIDTQVCPAIW